MFSKKRKLITILFLAGLISLLFLHSVQATPITYDDFSNLVASLGKWIVYDPDEISTYNESDGVVEINGPPISSWFYAISTYYFTGDFDIRMRYQDWSLTTSSDEYTNVSISLQVHPVGGGATNFVYIFRGAPNGSEGCYIANNCFNSDWGLSAGVQTNDTAGWLRITREDNNFSTYYSSDGTNWNFLYGASDGFTDPVLIQVSAYTGDTTTTFHAEFDQVDVESEGMTPIPEPGTMILLGSLATGLFGMAGLRRRVANR